MNWPEWLRADTTSGGKACALTAPGQTPKRTAITAQHVWSSRFSVFSAPHSLKAELQMGFFKTALSDLALRRRGFSRLARRRGWGGLGAATRIGLGRRGRRIGASGLFLGRFFVFFAAMIGDVEAGAFENQTRPRADEAFDLAFAPGSLSAQFLRANGQRGRRNPLKFLKLMSALLTNVFVSRHSLYVNSRPRPLGQEASALCSSASNVTH